LPADASTQQTNTYCCERSLVWAMVRDIAAKWIEPSTSRI